MSLKHKYEYLAPYNSEIFTELTASVPCIATCYNSELLASFSQVSALHRFCVRWLPNITALLYTLAGAAAATKKWRGLINIHDLDCTTKTVVSDQQASKTVRD